MHISEGVKNYVKFHVDIHLRFVYTLWCSGGHLENVTVTLRMPGILPLYYSVSTESGSAQT